VLIATLHTGFQFGWNVHTLCYVLIIIVIVSGIVGVVAYLRYPQAMSMNRAGSKPDRMLEEIRDIDQRALRIARDMPRRFSDLLRSNRDGTALGGSTRNILAGIDRSVITLPTDAGAVVSQNAGQSAALSWLGDELARSTDGELTRRIGDLLSLLAERRNLLRRVCRDAQIRGWLDIWLYVHVPVTLALLGTLIAHVVSVFLYW